MVPRGIRRCAVLTTTFLAQAVVIFAGIVQMVAILLYSRVIVELPVSPWKRVVAVIVFFIAIAISSLILGGLLAKLREIRWQRAKEART